MFLKILKNYEQEKRSYITKCETFFPGILIKFGEFKTKNKFCYA